jgi:hypothetical protein
VTRVDLSQRDVWPGQRAVVFFTAVKTVMNPRDP